MVARKRGTARLFFHGGPWDGTYEDLPYVVPSRVVPVFEDPDA